MVNQLVTSYRILKLSPQRKIRNYSYYPTIHICQLNTAYFKEKHYVI